MVEVEVILNGHKLHMFASMIATSLWDVLMFCPSPRNMKLVVKKTLFHVKICKYLPKYILPFKLAIAQQEVLAGVNKDVKENKQANSGIKLATKHVILNAIVSAHKEFSMITMAKTLTVCVKNIIGVVLCHKVIDQSRAFLWCLLVRKKKNGILVQVRNVVLQWWVSKTQMIPNKSDVTRKRLEVGAFNEKPTHFLMEIQICRFIPSFQFNGLISFDNKSIVLC
jgi:hypothetical protein